MSLSSLRRILLLALIMMGLLGPAATSVPAYNPEALDFFLDSSQDPTQGIEETSGTMARVDGRVLVCTEVGGSWIVNDYPAAKYCVDGEAYIQAFDVSHESDSDLIAHAVMDSSTGRPMVGSEQRSDDQFVFLLGEVTVVDEDENEVLHTFGTYVIKGAGRVQFSPE